MLSKKRLKGLGRLAWSRTRVLSTKNSLSECVSCHGAERVDPFVAMEAEGEPGETHQEATSGQMLL